MRRNLWRTSRSFLERRNADCFWGFEIIFDGRSLNLVKVDRIIKCWYRKSMHLSFCEDSILFFFQNVVAFKFQSIIRAVLMDWRHPGFFLSCLFQDATFLFFIEGKLDFLKVFCAYETTMVENLVAGWAHTICLLLLQSTEKVCVLGFTESEGRRFVQRWCKRAADFMWTLLAGFDNISDLNGWPTAFIHSLVVGRCYYRRSYRRRMTVKDFHGDRTSGWCLHWTTERVITATMAGGMKCLWMVLW